MKKRTLHYMYICNMYVKIDKTKQGREVITSTNELSKHYWKSTTLLWESISGQFWKERKGPAKFPLSCITLHLRDKIKYRHNILSGSTKEKCVTSNFRENSYTSSNLYNILAFNLDQIIEKCIIYSTK